MLKPVEARSRGGKPLAQWLARTIERSGMRVKFQVRGNHLHILCEGATCPDRTMVLKRLLPALKRTNLNTLVSAPPQIYQVLLYGRELGQTQPSWTVPLDLNQIDRHLEQLRPLAQPTLAAVGHTGSANPIPLPTDLRPNQALALSNRSLARRGDAAGVARYLSETLSALGVAVRVTVKTVPYQNQRADGAVMRRLWITCEADYSPDPALIGEPIAHKLRDLELEGFRDAIILIQVWGEAKPDWVLRVDLTPTHEMLREWARWGDVGAIARLLNQAVADHGICLDTTTQKESTLHLCWKASSQTASQTAAPNQQFVLNLVVPLLERIAPQGIHAAMLYGQAKGQTTPTWVKWLDLPASQHRALAEPALTLAQQGDWEAIGFLLNRLLNPDLDQQLATGGIRLQLLPKQDLLHVMTDAPVCPPQRQVTPMIIRFLRQLPLPVSGVRIYGRRSGQKRPLWSDGADFAPRSRLVPEATPEFAATDAFIGDLIARSDDLVLRPDLTTADIQTAWERLNQRVVRSIQQGLTRSHLFVAQPDVPNRVTAASESNDQGLWSGIVWGIAGLLLVVQTDWVVGRMIQLNARPAEVAAASTSASNPDAIQPELALSRSPLTDPEPFDSNGFTAVISETGSADPQNRATQTTSLALESPFDTFNSWQLDEKVALYTRRVADEGVPDVLIVGSSRALRGIDPTALRQSLAKLGYANVSVFNFGVNGATAQVVDLMLRRILTPNQLPRLIVWADGARAFNSGTVDVTYNGIVASEGYRQLADGTLPLPAPDSSTNGTTVPTAGTSLSASYQAIDRWFSQQLASVSSLHQERDRLKSLLQQAATRRLPREQRSMFSGIPADPTASDSTGSPSIPMQGQGMIDFDGFLPLSLRFNPATYYQQYARVSGEYDSDYESFQIVGRQADALNALLQLTHDRQIPVIFVNLPLTQEYLDPTRLQHEQEFKQYMLRLSLDRQGLIFRDLDELWLTQNDYFSDPSHLNRYGAREVSQRLAQDPMIPWAEAR